METPAQLLGAAIAARLDELGLSISAWKRASGVSDLTLRRLRDGQLDALSTAKERAAERALGWAPGAMQAVREGGKPTLASAMRTVPADLTDAQWEAVERLIAAFRQGQGR